MAKQSIVVHISGQRLVVRSDADESYVNKLADYVSDQIDQIQKSTKPISPHSLAILAALNITDELFQEQNKRAELKRRIKDKSKAVLMFLDQEVRARHRQQH